MHQLLSPQSQIIGASADDHWVVWSEAPDQPNFFDWTLFAYNLQSRQVQQLAQAVHVNGQAVAGPTPLPVVDQGMVIWGQPMGPVSPDTLENSVVKLEDLATGRLTTLATKAGSPGLSWPWVFWEQITTGSQGNVQFKNLRTEQETQLQSQPSSLTLAGTSVAYIDANLHTLSLLEDITQHTTNPQVLLQLSDAADHLQFVTMNDRLIGWVQDTTVQVWDRLEQHLVALPISNGASDSWVGGRTLVWLDPEPQAQQDQDSRQDLIPTPTLDVLDTATLPQAPVG